VNLSRHPKADAFEMEKLIRQYGEPQPLEIAFAQTGLNREAEGTAKIQISNTSSRKLSLNVEPEAFGGIEVQLEDAAQKHVNLDPDAKMEIGVDIHQTTTTPGFYHGFLRFTDEAGTVAGYGWVEARRRGSPTFNTDAGTSVSYPRGVEVETDLKYTRPIIVAYGEKCTVLEAEAAIAVAFTLESATGEFVNALSEETITPQQLESSQIIAVGLPNTCSIVAKALGKSSAVTSGPRVQRVSSPTGGPGDWMVVTADDPRGVSDAAMDYIVRYWTNAKDSAAGRVGLVEKQLERKGPDPVTLP
jgi:hypothetical protein